MSIIELPDDVSLQDVAVTVPAETWQKVQDRNRRLADANVELTDWLNKANQERDDESRQKLAAQQQASDANGQVQKLAAELTKARQEIDRLTVLIPKPTPPQPTSSGVPIINKSELRNIRMFTVTKDNRPSDSQDEATRQVIAAVTPGVFNVWRGFLNLTEVRTHVKMAPANRVNHLIRYGEDRGLSFVADTVDIPAAGMNDTDLREYLTGLKTIGAKALYLNDWFNYTKSEREVIVSRIRAVSTLPIIASLKASDNLADYPEVDFHEIQCFGTLEELETYLKRKDVDVWCIEGRKSAGVDFQKQAGALYLKYKPKAIAVYTAKERDNATNWSFADMKPQVTEIQNTMRALRQIQETA